MADAPLNQQEIRNLAEKLEQLDEILTDKEKAVILGVFDIASKALAEISRSERGAKLTEEDEKALGVEAQLSDNPKLSEGFLFYFGGPGKLPPGDASFPIRPPQ